MLGCAYTSVSTVCSSTLLGSLVDLDVLNDQIAGIKTLGIRVCLSVLEETEQELSGFDWPSSARDTESLACHPVNIALPVHPSFASKISYLGQHVQFLQHIFSSGPPPYAPGHSPRT